MGSRFGTVVVVIGCEQSARHAVVVAGRSPDILLPLSCSAAKQQQQQHLAHLRGR